MWMIGFIQGFLTDVERCGERSFLYCPAVVCLQAMSIHIGQARVSAHFRPSGNNKLARIRNLRITAVIASFLHLPLPISRSYLTFISRLKQVATTAGT